MRARFLPIEALLYMGEVVDEDGGEEEKNEEEEEDQGAVEDWRTKVPITLKWPDRGPIGGLFPSNYPGCKSSSPASCPNPRGWTWMGGKDAPSISTPF